MSKIEVPTDGQGHPLANIGDLLVVKTSPTAFAGGTGNARGDESGTGNPQSLFTVTGEVLVAVYGVCTTIIASTSGATIGVGTADNANGIIASTTATDIDADEVWADSTPSTDLISIDELTFYIVTNGNDIVETTANSQDIQSGQIYYVALYRPITADASLVAVN